MKIEQLRYTQYKNYLQLFLYANRKTITSHRYIRMIYYMLLNFFKFNLITYQGKCRRLKRNI